VPPVLDDDEELLLPDEPPQLVHPARDANKPAAITPATQRMLSSTPGQRPRKGRGKLANPRRGTTTAAWKISFLWVRAFQWSRSTE
jgi:hypothetical protein